MNTPIRTPWEDAPKAGEMIEVAPGVHWARLPLPMTLDHVNVYALEEDDGWTIIDTGFASKTSRDIWQQLLDGPLAAKPVTRVIGTHHHPDHIGLAGWFQREHGAELWMTRTAWLFARMLVLDEEEKPTREAIDFYRSAGMDPDLFAAKLNDRPFNFADIVEPMPLGFTRIEEGSEVNIGGRNWIVRFGQGHAPDHATFWSLDDNLVIAGDQLLATISPNLGVYPTEPNADPVGEWLSACEALSPFALDDQLVLPGHKLPFTGLPTRMVQLAENHHSALRRLLEFLKEPKIGGECFMPLFKREIRGGAYGLALAETVAHLNHLHQKGQISRTRRDDGAWLWQTCRQ